MRLIICILKDRCKKEPYMVIVSMKKLKSRWKDLNVAQVVQSERTTLYNTLYKPEKSLRGFEQNIES